MVNEWYKEWFNSSYYHQLYFNRDEKEAQDFIDRLIQYLNPSPESRMLDAGCGRGRHAHYLASKGFDVTGIDLSFSSIDFARQFEAENLHFYQQDMRLPSWINYYDYVFNFFTSFGYFNTRREHDDVVRTLSNSLKKGGIILFDFLNVRYAEDYLVHNETKKVEETEYQIHRWHDTNHFYKRIVIKDAALDSPVDFIEKVAKLTLGDFTDMLSFQKVQVEEVFGDYALNPYDVRKSPRLIVLGRKL